MEITAIIPALNEEELLPDLLDDLRRQTFGRCEIIVADAGSTDRTREIARDHGASVVKGGNPPAGRNNGARAAQGNFLFFLDADVRLPETFLQDAYSEIEERYLDLATCEVVPLSEDPVDKFLHDFANFGVKMSQYSDPHAPGFCILSSARLFRRIGGFDETIKIGEDHDFVKRGSAFRPLRVLHRARISVSVRRLEKEGRAGLVSKYLAVEIHRALFGEVRNDDFVDYKFDDFDGKSENSGLLDKLRENYSNLLSELGESPTGEKLSGIRDEFETIKEKMKEKLAPR